MPEEILRETAAASEPPKGLTSSEFFFLLQRVDRLDEKFTGEIREVNRSIKALDEKLTREIKALDEKFTENIQKLDYKFAAEIKRLEEKLNEKFGALQLWFVGTLVTLIIGFGGIIAALLRR